MTEDLKLVTGNAIGMSIFTGPHYPNASTPLWHNNVPTFDCSTPFKVGCLFNLTADPTEHHDLALERPQDALRLLDLLKNSSRTFFDPNRGDYTPGFCRQMQGPNRGFFGPWLELQP